MDASSVIFFVLATLLVIASLLVVFLRNVVHCAMALVAALLLISIFFVTLQAPMLGILQVLVYAGAIMVLFLFVIMFLNPTTLENPGRAWWVLGSIMGLLLAVGLVPMLTKHQPAGSPLAATESLGSPEMLAKNLFSDF